MIIPLNDTNETNNRVQYYFEWYRLEEDEYYRR